MLRCILQIKLIRLKFSYERHGSKICGRVWLGGRFYCDNWPDALWLSLSDFLPGSICSVGLDACWTRRPSKIDPARIWRDSRFWNVPRRVWWKSQATSQLIVVLLTYCQCFFNMNGDPLCLTSCIFRTRAMTYNLQISGVIFFIQFIRYAAVLSKYQYAIEGWTSTSPSVDGPYRPDGPNIDIHGQLLTSSWVEHTGLKYLSEAINVCIMVILA